MKNVLLNTVKVFVTVLLFYMAIKQITCPIPSFNEQEIEFIQNEEYLK